MSTPMMQTLTDAITLLGVNMPTLDPDMRPQAHSTALLIIDVQRDFCPPPTPGEKGWGALAVKGGNDIVPIINTLRKSVKFDYVILSQDYHSFDQASFASRYSPEFPPMTPVKFTYASGRTVPAQNLWPNHCVIGSEGVEFHPDLLFDEKNDIVVRKGKNPHVDSYSAFCDNLKNQETTLHKILKDRNIMRIVVVGLAYDYCVGFTALDGYAKRYDVIVCKDACRSVDPGKGEQDMTKTLISTGIQVITSDEYISSVVKPNQRKRAAVYTIELPNEMLVSVNDIPIEQISKYKTHYKTNNPPLTPGPGNGETVRD
jgi:nicotinamidase/pyrazinamidase